MTPDDKALVRLDAEAALKQIVAVDYNSVIDFGRIAIARTALDATEDKAARTEGTK